MDWTASGIENRFEYETLTMGMAHAGWLDGVTGGTITESYRGDYRVTASLELDGSAPRINGYVRIWNVATLGGETVRTCLATLVPDLPGGEYRLGRWTRSVELNSAMKKLSTTLRPTDSGFAKDTVLATYWRDIVRGNGAIPVVSSGISTTARAIGARVWEFGSTILSNLHDVAGWLGGYMEIDPYGRVCLVPYVQPSKRSASWTLSSGESSIMLLGVAMDAPEPVNRVIARYETGAGKVYYSKADVAASHPWSGSNIGRIVTEVLDDPQGSGDGWLGKLTRQRLAELSDYSALYEVTTLFHPSIRPGTVGKVSYSDAPGSTGLSFRAFCSQREIQLDPAMTTTLTLEELR